MNKRRYSNRRRKNILRVFILLMTIIITVVMWRTIKIDVQVGELTLPKILQSEKSFADTSGEWNLIFVDRKHYIPNNYQVELTELSNGKKVDSRIYPELQQMFNDARAEGLALFVREGYRTTEEAPYFLFLHRHAHRLLRRRYACGQPSAFCFEPV